MANITAKTSNNVFYKARCEAATHNEQLSSREGAADIMSIDRGRLYRIESGITNPYPEEIRLMADLYNAPELENYYCTDVRVNDKIIDLAWYNEKQTRNDRRIDDYYEKILSGKQKKPFYEIVVQIGDKDNMGTKVSAPLRSVQSRRPPDVLHPRRAQRHF